MMAKTTGTTAKAPAKTTAKAADGRTTRYTQIADELREQITSGQYPPLAYLPSETQLSAHYGTSRRTVHDAVAQLRREGLVIVINGKGAYVRPVDVTPRRTDTRAITHSSAGYVDTATDGWTEVEEPTTYRVNANTELSELLGVPVHTPVFVYDRLLTNPADPTGDSRKFHRLYLPFQTVDLAVNPEQDPFIPAEQLYAVLTEAGHKLSWVEYVTARNPSPDDARTLRIPEATPMITTRRVTLDSDGTPLALEETRQSGDQTRLAYTITATRPVRAAR
jgi:GntR family transcriptional regulator